VASVLTTSPINFGIVHVNDPTQTKNVTVQNGATATALNDVLIGSISAGSGPFSGSGNLGGGLGPQAQSSALQVNFATGTAGIFSGAANLALASHDAQLADLSLTTSPISLEGQVNHYAALSFLQQGGQGNLTGGGNAFTLDFGNIIQGGPTPEALLAFLNNNPLADQAFTDLLSSIGTVESGSGFTITGDSVSGLTGGATQGGFDIGFDTSNLGSFSETLSFDVESSNSSLYDQIIGSVTFTIEGDIVSSGPSVPEPGTLSMLASGFGMLFFVARRRRRMQ
jgi:PEP-CTERM motif